jgi:hypothetical protein
MAVFIVTLMVLSAISVLSIPAISSTTKDKFDDGLMVKEYDPGDPPEMTLPAGVTILQASLDIEGRASVTASQELLNFNDTNTQGWYGASSEDPMLSAPASLKKNAIDASSEDDIKEQDGEFFQSLGDNSGGPYHLFSFLTTTEPTKMENIKVHWKGRGEEPMIDSLARWRASLHIWNDADSSWEGLESYGWSMEENLKVLGGNITNDFGDYIDNDDRIYVLARGVIFGTPWAYLDSDFVEIDIDADGGVEYPTALSLRLEDGGSVVWNQAGELNGRITLGDSVLKVPIQAMSDAAKAASQSDFTISINVTYTGLGRVFLSNMTIIYGETPEAVHEGITAHFDEDTDAEKLIDLYNHFSDEAPLGELTFEIIYEEDNTKIDASVASDGHSLSFTTPTEHWYGSMGFGIKVTDSDDLYLEFDNITVTVDPVNDDPVALGIPDQEGTEDEDCSDTFVDLWAYFEDGGWEEDPVENLTYRLPPQLNPTSADGTAVGLILNKRYFTCRPSADFNGPVTFIVEVKDHEGATVQDEFMVDFKPVNDEPVFKSNPETTAKENNEYTYTVLVEDIDHDPIEITIDDGPENMTIEDNVLTWVPGDLDVGDHEVSLMAADNDTEVYQDFTIKVLNINDRPTIPDKDPIKATVDKELNVTIEAEDLDLDFNPVETLTFSDDTDLFEIDPYTGTIVFTPVWTQAGEHHVNITVTDMAGAEDTAEIVIEVDFKAGSGTPSVSIVTPTNGSTVKVGKATEFTAKLLNPGVGDWNLTWEIDGEVAGYGEKPDLVFTSKGAHTVKVVATDGNEDLEDSIEVKAKPKKSDDNVPGFEMAFVLLAFVMVLGLLRRRNIHR